MDEILVLIFICVVLPVAIVWLVTFSRRHETDKKTEVLLKAIETGQKVDVGQLGPRKETRTIKERLLSRLTAACVTALLGVAFLVAGLVFCIKVSWFFRESIGPSLLVAGATLFSIGIALYLVYRTGRKMLKGEMEAEEKSLTRTN